MQLTRDLESIVATALLLLSGFLSPAGAQSDSLPPFPPPGRLIDIGGWKLHLNCTGEKTPGKPTVILEAGVGAFSVDWALVQPSGREICAGLFLRPRRKRLERSRAGPADHATNRMGASFPAGKIR